MKLFQALNGVDYCILKGGDTEITALEIDSRKVLPGGLFACISGFNVDRHGFIPQAVSQGAAAILVEKNVMVTGNVAVVKVHNAREALSYIASNFYGRPDRKFDLIGITGTNGKTSSTYFMEAVLKEAGYPAGVIGTVGIRANGKPLDIPVATSTTPDSIELFQIFNELSMMQMPKVVMEVTSHALELKKLAGVEFLVSVFTNLTQDHLDLHGSMEQYRDAKALLFGSSLNSVINADDPYGAYMVSAAAGKVMTFSIEKDSDIKASNIEYTGNNVSFMISYDGNQYDFNVPIPGKFTVYNALGVIGASIALGIPMETIRKALSGLQGVPGRIQGIPNNRGVNVYVDYAHTPDALENIIKSVREFTSGKVITIFGCGGDRDRTKRPIMGEIAGRLSDYSIITSDNPRTENPAQIIDEIEPGVLSGGSEYIKITDRKEAIFHGIKIAEQGDSVIIAGKGHETYQIFPHGTVHFDDAEVANEALNTEE